MPDWPHPLWLLPITTLAILFAIGLAVTAPQGLATHTSTFTGPYLPYHLFTAPEVLFLWNGLTWPYVSSLPWGLYLDPTTRLLAGYPDYWLWLFHPGNFWPALTGDLPPFHKSSNWFFLLYHSPPNIIAKHALVTIPPGWDNMGGTTYALPPGLHQTRPLKNWVHSLHLCPPRFLCLTCPAMLPWG